MKIKSLNSSKDYSLSDSVFKVAMNDQAVYQCVIAELTNARQGTRSTKNRSLVSGGGKKPFKQKGTGNARHASRKAPIFVWGGVAHGTKGELTYKTRKLNKSEKKSSIASLISEKNSS